MDAVSLFHRLTGRASSPAPAPHAIDYQPARHVADVAKYHVRIAASGDAAHLDDITWEDMLLPEFAARLSDGVSLVGRQSRYRQLRRGGDVSSRAALRARQETIDQDPAACAAIATVAAWLDRQSGQAPGHRAAALLRPLDDEAA